MAIEQAETTLPVSPPIESPPLAYRWVIAGNWIAGNAGLTLTVLSLGVLMPYIKEDLGLSTFQQGLLGSSLRIGNVVLAIPFSLWLSGFSERRLVLFTFALAALLVLAQAWSPVFWVFVIARLGFGIAMSARTPARALLIRAWFPNRDVPMVQGLFLAGSGLAEFSTLFITPFLLIAYSDNWRPVLYTYSGVMLLVTALWFVSGRDHPNMEQLRRDKKAERAPWRSLFSYPVVWLVGACSAGSSVAWWAFQTFWPDYMLTTYKTSLVWSGFALGLLSLGMVPTTPLIGRAISRGMRRGPIFIVCGVGMAGAHIGMITTHSVWAISLFGMLGGLSWAFIVPVLTLPFELPNIKTREIAVLLSFLSTMILLGGMVGPLLVGAVASLTGSLFVGMLLVSFAPLSICGLAFVKVKRQAVT